MGRVLVWLHARRRPDARGNLSVTYYCGAAGWYGGIAPMQRPITGFARDESGDWTALLSCGHRQHVRHDPPFVSRPWTVTAAGRASRRGEHLDCVRCDRFELPDACVAFERTPEFTEDSIPNGLRARHVTVAGVWGRIVVTAGALRYRCAEFGIDVALTPELPGIVVPEASHEVDPAGPVRFFVEFLHVPDLHRAAERAAS